MNSSALHFPIGARLWKSTIGRKLLVAVTGLVLTLFLAGHLSGNLLIYVGQEAFNEYAYFLHHLLHGAGVWVARLALLTCLVIHVAATISLTRENRAAREKKYHCDATIQASKSSRIMIWTGSTILAFVIFHLLHFTVRVTYPADKYEYTLEDGTETFDAYQMVIDGFSHPLVVLFYVIAISLLCSHIGHGVQSMFQTLGLRSKKTAGFLKYLSNGYAIFIWLGFISIPISILLFNVGRS